MSSSKTNSELTAALNTLQVSFDEMSLHVESMMLKLDALDAYFKQATDPKGPSTCCFDYTDCAHEVHETAINTYDLEGDHHYRDAGMALTALHLGLKDQ